MKINEIAKLIDCKRIIGDADAHLETEYHYAFSSDLMSDVLRLTSDDTLLITGLCNTQTLRTVEMAEIKLVVLGRGKKTDKEMEKLALENDICILESDYSLYRISGILYANNVLPIY